MDVPTVLLAHPPLPPSSNLRTIHLGKFLLIHRSLRRPQLLNVSPLLSHQLVHTMADADSSITDSSLAPSTTPTSLLESGADALPILLSDRSYKGERRASLGLIDAARVRLSKDFYSLLRSNSKSQPIPTALSTQSEVPEDQQLVYSDYVKLSAHAVDLQVKSMDDPADERPGRGLGARIVNFLNRSRSRSRSKKRRSRSLDAIVDPMPATVHTASLRLHARHSSLEHDQEAAAAGPSRPMTRSPSRPLSGTTSPLPSTSKPRSRRVPEQIAIPNGTATATAELVAQLVPMETTKSTSSRKGKSFNFFGMLLSSPRKSSFGESMRGRSRPTTPSPAVPATAPVPDSLWHGSSDDSHQTTWATKSGSQRSQKSTRKGLPVHVEEEPSGQCLSSCVPADHYGKTSALPGLLAPQPRRPPVHVLSPQPPLPRGGYLKSDVEVDDGDTRASVMEGRCSPLCGLGGSSKGSHTSQDKGKEKERMRGARERSREGSGQREKEKEREAERDRERDKARERRREQEMREKDREHITHPRRVGSPFARDSAVAITAVPLEKTTSNRSAGSKHSGSKDNHTSTRPPHAHSHSRSGAEMLTARTKRIKHGSFDFERPVSAGVGGANAGVSVKTALRSMGVGAPAPTPHPLQRSSSARGAPSRRGTDESQDSAFAPSSLPHNRSALDKGKGRTTGDVRFADLPARRPTDNSHASTTQTHHRHGHSSSISQTRSALAVPSHHHHPSHPSHPNQHPREPPPASPLSSHSGSSSHHGRNEGSGSWGRSGGKRMAARGSHGPFKFEPAVPPIPGSPADNERRREAREREAARAESPLSDVPISRSQHARAAGKGRSLDLGLGLSWAPTRVKEDAVLRRVGVSASTSAARSKSRWRGVDEEGRLAAGAASDVAAAFKEVLGDSAYGIFKNYVHRFDANAIPLDGPYGLLVHVERLLDGAPGVDQRRKRMLLEKFLRVVQDSEYR
ncbi:hypothetical protein C2E23DRAFT_298815, partial [Lenzites betulinus]